MKYAKQRRVELWIVAIATAAIGVTLVGFAIKSHVSFLWWFAAPFLLFVPVVIWKATRSDGVFDEEQKREEEFTKKHPVLSALFVLGALAGGLWAIGSAVFRLFGFLIKHL